MVSPALDYKSQELLVPEHFRSRHLPSKDGTGVVTWFSLTGHWRAQEEQNGGFS
jgi:hypothetical protein